MRRLSASTLLLFLLGLFAPLGSGLQQVVPFDISKCFPLLCLFLILSVSLDPHLMPIRSTKCAGLYHGPSVLPTCPVDSGYPRAMWLFLGFVALHSMITYGIFCRGELAFGYTGDLALQGGFTRATEGIGIKLVRVFLFALAGWAVARTVSKRESMICLSVGYSLGLLASTLAGGYETTHVLFGNEESRISAGLLDANAYGLSALTCSFLLMMIRPALRSRPARIACLLAISGSLGCIILSGSRGAMLATAVGFVVHLFKARRRALLTVGVIGATVLSVIAVEYFRPSALGAAGQRMSVSRLEEDAGGARLFIWRDYLTQAKAYVPLGVGFLRAIAALNPATAHRMSITHNIYLGSVVEFGVVGALLLLAALRSLYRKCLKSPPVLSVGLTALLAAWAACSFFLDSIQLRETWLIFGVCSAAFNREGCRDGVVPQAPYVWNKCLRAKVLLAASGHRWRQAEHPGL